MSRIETVTSTANPKVKAIKALQLKKHRDEEKAFLAEGMKLVIDALEQGWTIRTLVYAREAGKAADDLAAKAHARGAQILVVNQKVLTAITRKDNPQTVIGVFEQRLTPLPSLKPETGDLIVALDRVRDPGNLGTVIRTCDAVGAKAVILIGDTTDPFSVEAVRATMGSVFAVPLVRTSEQAFIDWAGRQNATIAGTHLKGAVDYRKPDWNARANIVVMGNEQQGLTDELAAACTVLARIPQAGKADSLNLAVATGVMLFEVQRSRLSLGDGA